MSNSTASPCATQLDVELDEVNRQETADTVALALNRVICTTAIAVESVITEVLLRVKADVAECKSLEEMGDKVNATIRKLNNRIRP